MVDLYKVDMVFKQIDSRIREDNFLSVKSGEKIQISFDEFYLKTKKYFVNARSSFLQIKSCKNDLPSKLEDQTFIKQLIDIDEINANDIEVIIILTKHRLHSENNLTDWLIDGEITMEEINDYHSDAKLKWKIEFDRMVKQNRFTSLLSKLLNSGQKNHKARELVYELRKLVLSINHQELNTEMSNGEFYHLSNLPEIGWLEGWEKKYKK